MLETCRPLGIVTIKRMQGYTEKGAGALGICYQQNQEFLSRWISVELLC